MTFAETAEYWNTMGRRTRSAVLRKLTSGPLGLGGNRYYKETDVQEMAKLSLGDHSQNLAIGGTDAEALWMRISSSPVALFLPTKMAWILNFIP